MFGVEQAQRYHSDLFTLLHLIADNPRIAGDRDEICPPVRIHSFKSHIIVYRIDEGDAIFVIRIRHGHEDWASDSI